jgi:hypothetical protein
MNARHAAENIETFGAASLRAATMELGGTLTTLAEQVDADAADTSAAPAPEPPGKKWRDAAKKVLTRISLAGMTIMLEYAAQKEIGYKP